MATTRVEHGGTVHHNHQHHHVHEHHIVNDGGGSMADAARGGTGREGLRKAQEAFHQTESGGATPRD